MLGENGEKPMRIIIAGGSGLIGRALTSALVIDGNEVTILSRNPGKVIGMPGGVKILEWDARTVQEWGKEIDKTDAVINLVGENLSGEGLLPSRWTKDRKDRLLRSRVDAGNVLTNAIEMSDNKPAVFVQASGIGIYGTNPEKQFTEASSVADDFLANLSKQWEASTEPVEALGVRRMVVRTGVVLSTKGGALRPLLLPYRFFIGGPIGNGKQVYSWIHIDDEVNAIRFLIEHDQTRGVFNLSSPNPVTNNEFGKTISMVMRRPHFLPLPGFIMQLAFGEVASMVLEGQMVLPKKLLEVGYVFKYPTLDKALKDLLK
jgi:uncharacterized protein (TIGR01777 family)